MVCKIPGADIFQAIRNFRHGRFDTEIMSEIKPKTWVSTWGDSEANPDGRKRRFRVWEDGLGINVAREQGPLHEDDLPRSTNFPKQVVHQFESNRLSTLLESLDAFGSDVSEPIRREMLGSRSAEILWILNFESAQSDFGLSEFQLNMSQVYSEIIWLEQKQQSSDEALKNRIGGKGSGDVESDDDDEEDCDREDDDDEEYDDDEDGEYYDGEYDEDLDEEDETETARNLSHEDSAERDWWASDDYDVAKEFARIINGMNQVTLGPFTFESTDITDAEVVVGWQMHSANNPFRWKLEISSNAFLPSDVDDERFVFPDFASLLSMSDEMGFSWDADELRKQLIEVDDDWDAILSLKSSSMVNNDRHGTASIIGTEQVPGNQSADELTLLRESFRRTFDRLPDDIIEKERELEAFCLELDGDVAPEPDEPDSALEKRRLQRWELTSRLHPDIVAIDSFWEGGDGQIFHFPSAQSPIVSFNGTLWRIVFSDPRVIYSASVNAVIDDRSVRGHVKYYRHQTIEDHPWLVGSALSDYEIFDRTLLSELQASVEGQASLAECFLNRLKIYDSSIEMRFRSQLAKRDFKVTFDCAQNTLCQPLTELVFQIIPEDEDYDEEHGQAWGYGRYWFGFDESYCPCIFIHLGVTELTLVHRPTYEDDLEWWDETADLFRGSDLWAELGGYDSYLGEELGCHELFIRVAGIRDALSFVEGVKRIADEVLQVHCTHVGEEYEGYFEGVEVDWKGILKTLRRLIPEFHDEVEAEIKRRDLVAD